MLLRQLQPSWDPQTSPDILGQTAVLEPALGPKWPYFFVPPPGKKNGGFPMLASPGEINVGFETNCGNGGTVATSFGGLWP